MSINQLFQKFVGLLEITRPQSCIGVGFTTFLGFHLSNNIIKQSYIYSLLPISIICMLCAASMVFNDYLDVSVDKINSPHRPIPSGKVSKKTALYFSILLMIVPIILAFIQGGYFIPMTASILIISVLYNIQLKSTVLIGNATVAMLVSFSILFGAISNGTITLAVMVACIMAFLLIFSREILKSIADKEGDCEVGIITVATKFGNTFSFQIFQINVLIVTVIALLPPFFNLTSYLYILSEFLFCILPLWIIVHILRENLSVPLVKKSVSLLKYFLYISIIPVIFMS